MKCWLHPKVDAVVACKSCGRGLCRDCAITISGQSYCKECIEKGVIPPRVTTAPEPIPTPAGVPTKGVFIVGGIGSIMNVVAAVLLFFSSSFYFLFNEFWEGDVLMTDISETALVFIGILLAGIGYRGIRRNYGSDMGTASFTMGIVACVFFIFKLVAGVIVSSSYESYNNYYESSYSMLWWFAWMVTSPIFGASQIIWGVTHIVTRRFVNSDLSMATGILLIIAGSFTASVYLSSVGIILFVVAEIMVTILFFISKVPTPQP